MKLNLDNSILEKCQAERESTVKKLMEEWRDNPPKINTAKFFEEEQKKMKKLLKEFKGGAVTSFFPFIPPVLIEVKKCEEEEQKPLKLASSDVKL